MDENNVYSERMQVCDKNKEIIRMCMHVKELVNRVNMRDWCMNGIFNNRECNDLYVIAFLCTE